MRRLSYADRLKALSYMLLVAAVIASSALVAWKSYTIASYNAEHGSPYVSDEIYYVDSARRYLRDLFGVKVDESMFSNKTRPDYYNLEHPPLGKYIIALSIALLGDDPLNWRVPGIVEASLLPAILGVALYYARRDPLGALAGAVAALALAADPIVSYSASVAMLDIHLAFFEALTLGLLVGGRRRLALVAAGLTLSVKMSGVAAVLLLIGYSLLFDEGVRGKLRGVSEAILIPVLVYAILLAPLAAYFGPVKLVDETMRAIEWHTTSRPPGPPTSTPIEWILNGNPFYYSFGPVAFAGVLNTVLHIEALILAAPLIVASSALRRPPASIGSLLYVSVIATYLIVYLMGNKTLYSFYSVQLSPAMAAGIASTLLLLGVGDE